MKITIELNERELEGLLFGRKVPEKKIEYVTYEEMMDYRSRQIAEIVLNDIREVALLYGYVTVADYKDLLHMRGLIEKEDMQITYKDNMIGWLYHNTIRNAEVVRYKDGWKIDLPDPIELK